MKITESNIRKIIRDELFSLMEQEDPKPKKIDDLEFKSPELREYERWSRSHGHVSPEVQGTLVSYILSQGLKDAHALHEKLCDELGLDHDNVMAAVEKRLPKEEDDETAGSARILDLEQVVEAIAKL
jgi:hypothetical protein